MKDIRRCINIIIISYQVLKKLLKNVNEIKIKYFYFGFCFTEIFFEIFVRNRRVFLFSGDNFFPVKTILRP